MINIVIEPWLVCTVACVLSALILQFVGFVLYESVCLFVCRFVQWDGPPSSQTHCFCFHEVQCSSLHNRSCWGFWESAWDQYSGGPSSL